MTLLCHALQDQRILAGPFPDSESREAGYLTAWAWLVCLVCWQKREVYIKTRYAWTRAIVASIIQPWSPPEWESYQQQKEIRI